MWVELRYNLDYRNKDLLGFIRVDTIIENYDKS